LACSTAIVAACGGATADRIDSFTIRYNDTTMGANWYEAANENHIDGIHTWTSGGTMAALSIYGNYIHGGSEHCTAPIYLTDNLATSSIYNNLIVGGTVAPGEGYLNFNLTGTADAYVFENTIVGIAANNTGGNGIAADPSRAGTTLHLRNNSISNCFVGLYDGTAAATWDSDYNLISNCGSVAIRSSWMTTLAAWQAATGADSHSTASPPNLSQNYYVPTAPSPAIGTGADLTALGKTLGVNFATDIAGNQRSAWDIGMVKAGTATWAVGFNSASGIIAPYNAVITIEPL
jgi:hypothetical protein